MMERHANCDNINLEASFWLSDQEKRWLLRFFKLQYFKDHLFTNRGEFLKSLSVDDSLTVWNCP